MTYDDSHLLSIIYNVLGKYDLNEIIECALRFSFRNPYGGLTIVDKEGCVQYMDRKTENFFGFEQGEAKGVDVRDLIPKSNLIYTATTGKPMIGSILEVKGIKRISSVYPLIKNGELIGAVGNIIFRSFEELERVNREVQRLKKEIHVLKQNKEKDYSSHYTFDNILGSSPLIRETIATAKKIAPLDMDVLIAGESGTGKELFAHGIHSFVDPDKPFIKVNCPAIPFELAEAQLFGYERGSFTGAAAGGKAGVFEAADGGTVFLDEISSLPLSVQAKLLRVLQEREVARLGSTRTKKLNFRSIAATNENLQQLVKEGKFRHDLYYRVAKATINVPSLRARTEDIPLYLNSFLTTICRSFKIEKKAFSPEALQFLIQYDWPGNVRELINVLEQIVINSWQEERITAEHLPLEIRHRGPVHASKTDAPVSSLNVKQNINNLERAMIVEALKEAGGNKRAAAKILNMPRSSLYKKLDFHKIGGEQDVAGGVNGPSTETPAGP